MLVQRLQPFSGNGAEAVALVTHVKSCQSVGVSNSSMHNLNSMSWTHQFQVAETIGVGVHGDDANTEGVQRACVRADVGADIEGERSARNYSAEQLPEIRTQVRLLRAQESISFVSELMDSKAPREFF
jgi:hypothetical protein